MATDPSSTMLAAVATRLPSRHLDLIRPPRPAPQAEDDVVREVEACGVCGTDLHILAGESYRPELPFVLGHEPVGLVVDAGPAARDWIGRRATLTLFTGEGSCPQCRAGDERLCPDLVSITGVLGAWGAYAEAVVVHARQLVEVPATLSGPAAASLVDSGATAANAVRVALSRAPERVLVLGAGPIGHLSAELLRFHGVTTQVVETNPARRDALADLGHDVVESVAAAAGGAPVVIDCAGVPGVVPPGLDALGPRGLYLLAGYARVPEVDLGVVARKEAEIRGLRSGRREDLDHLVALAATDQIRLPHLSLWRLSEVNRALDALREGQVAGKAVIVPDTHWKDPSA